MKNIIYILFMMVALIGCAEDDMSLPLPSEVHNVTVKPIVGGIVVRWNLPADSNFTYVEVSYEKKGETIRVPVSKYTDSLVIEGLLNKLEYKFQLRTVSVSSKDRVYGPAVLETDFVKPLRRPIQVTYFSDVLTKIEGITSDMLDTYTQETTEGPKTNLVDGNISTYWHSAWSGATAPLPHWIILKSTETKSIGIVKYNFRQNTSTNGRPSQFALDISDDGISWERVWTSREGLAVDPVGEEKVLNLGSNHEAKYHKLLILKTSGNTNYAHLGEISYHTMREDLVDTEIVAEENY